MKVYEGTIITCDAEGSVTRFLVEDRGRIVHVGDSLPEQFSRSPRVALGNDALCPAFADTHIHFLSHALFSNGLDVQAARTIPDLARAVADYAASHRDKILIGFGASAHCVAERRLVNRQDLDQACPDRPVFLVKYDGHAAVINSALRDILPGRSAASAVLTPTAD